MPSVDDVLRHAFEHNDDEWARVAPAAHSAVLAQHHRGQRVRRGLAGSAVAVAAAVVLAMTASDVQPPQGVKPADPAPKTGTPPPDTPLEGRWTSSPLDASDVRAAARAAGSPRSATAMLDVLPRVPFTVVVVVHASNLETSVKVAGRAREILDRESISVARRLVTIRPLTVSAATVYRWSIDGDVLTLTFRSTTEGEADGAPGEAWQRLLYNSVAFTR